MKKILLFSRDPGGANTVIPVYETLCKKKYSVFLYGKDFALKRYADAGYPGIDIMTKIQEVSISEIRNILSKIAPDFIITGTSADDFTEKYIWENAEELGIPCFAIIDQWLNYGVRFSEYSVSGLEEFNNNSIHKYLPSKICVMDEVAFHEMVGEGFEPGRILVTGQPYFETLRKKRDYIANITIDEIRNRFGAALNDCLITFASEPISDTYHEDDFSEHYWGYSERTILNELLLVLEKLSELTSRNIILIIKQHPKEKPDNYNDVIGSCTSSNIRISVAGEINQYELIAASDIICGMSSMFLIESVIMKKPTVSIQIGLNRENPFILDRLGYLRSILKYDDLFIVVKDIIEGKQSTESNFDFIDNPVDNIITQMEKILWQN